MGSIAGTAGATTMNIFHACGRKKLLYSAR
jgi:hypothetical protein